MGFPPNNFPRGPHGPNRGGMPAQNFGGRGGMQYPNSPQPARGSPAMPHAIPGQGTPNMNAAMPVPPPQYAHQHQYPPPMSGGYAPQVKTLSSQASFLPFNQKAPNKKKSARWDHENRLSRFRQPDPSVQHSGQDLGGKSRRLSKQRDSATDYNRPRGRGPMLDHQAPPYHPQVPYDAPVDLTPGSDGFAHLEHMLTASKQNFNNYGFDPTRAPYMGMPAYNPQMPMGGYAPGSPAPGGYPYAPGGQFAVPQGQPMSRNNSQMSERPASATGNPNQMGAPGPPQPQKPIIATSTPSNQFVRPKSKQIKIRNAAGEEVSLASLTTTTTASPAAASPAPSIQQSKTPPVIASTPTPPPKASTPAPKASTPTSQGREESASEAKGDDIRAIFLEQVKKSKEGEVEATKTDDKSAVEEAKPVEEKQEVEQAEPEEKADEPIPTPAPAPVEAEPKPKDESEVKPKDEPEAKVEPEKTEVAAKADEKPAETEDEYMERMIREMEEEDARREAEQAKITAQKTAEKEAAKKKADEERLASSAENDRKLREQEREMERLEEEKERKAREQSEAAEDGKSVAELLAGKISDLTASQKKDTSSVADKLGKLTINNTRDPSALSPGSGPSSAKSTGKDRRPAALNLAPLKTGSVEAPPPSAAMQALKSARFLTIRDEIKYPSGISSPNPATNAAAAKKGGSFKYDSAFLLQFQKAFTEQPSVEFSQQVKALIGDSDGTRSASTRGSGQGPRTGSKNGPSGGAFGSFTQPASGKPLPPGTTSDQRFAMAQGQMARPMSGAMSFGRGGAFPGPSQMSRTASNLGMNSRSGSRTQTRGGSKQGHPQADAKLAKTMPLTQGMDLKPITTSSTGWKPMSLTRNAAQSAEADYMAPDVVQRKVKAALNKMTPENFEKISKQILEIAAQSKDEQDGRTLRQVIQLTFEKATDEAHWAAMYAKFCKRMLENMSPEVKDVTITDKNGNVVSGGALFRKYLLNRCQEDFERGWNVDMPEPKEGESKETAMMSEEYYKAMTVKRRGLGLVQFIGELFKLGMLTERIMHECVRKLLDFKDEPDEAEIESLSKLLRTIGGNLDSTEKGHAFMNAYFERISNLVASPELPSRLKFMLMDIVDLRKKQWAEKEGLKGPKTLDEIRAEVSFPDEDLNHNLVNNRILTHARLRLLPLQRPLKLLGATPDTSQEAVRRWDVVMLATRTTRSTHLHPTRSAWTISAVSRAPHHGLLAATSRLDPPRCSTPGATVVASWVLAARSPAVMKILPLLQGLARLPLKHLSTHLRKLQFLHANNHRAYQES